MRNADGEVVSGRAYCWEYVGTISAEMIEEIRGKCPVNSQDANVRAIFTVGAACSSLTLTDMNHACHTERSGSNGEYLRFNSYYNGHVLGWEDIQKGETACQSAQGEWGVL